MKTEYNPRDVVTSFLKALNDQDVNLARNYIDENVSFMAPDGAPIKGAEAYINGWKGLGLSYETKKIFAEGDDVCVLYDLKFSKSGVTILGCGWYHVLGRKIDSIMVIFDPRRLLQQQK